MMEAYAAEINKLLQQIYPEQFTYDGFTITNPDHCAKPLVNSLLAGIGYLKGLFKDNGLLPILEKEITSFGIAFQPIDSKFHGLYNGHEKKITLYHVASQAGDRSGRLLKTWIKEVFLHEFGHHIHINYIHGIARDFWDSWWDLIEDAKKLAQVGTPITWHDRQEYYLWVVTNHYDPVKVVKTTKNIVDRARFLIWLNNPSKGYKDKITTQLNLMGLPRLTKLGVDMFSFYRDSYEYLEKRYPEISKDGTGYVYQEIYEKVRREQFDPILGITQSQKSLLWPVLSPMEAKDIKKLVAKDLNVKFANDILAITDFGLPSGYAHESKYEDFAETFVSFVTNPRSLSPIALYRMKRTLSLSGLYGKPVMTFAQVVEALVDSGYEQEGRQLLRAYVGKE